MHLQGRAARVTGADSGIGQAIPTALAWGFLATLAWAVRYD